MYRLILRFSLVSSSFEGFSCFCHHRPTGTRPSHPAHLSAQRLPAPLEPHSCQLLPALTRPFHPEQLSTRLAHAPQLFPSLAFPEPLLPCFPHVYSRITTYVLPTNALLGHFQLLPTSFPARSLLNTYYQPASALLLAHQMRAT